MFLKMFFAAFLVCFSACATLSSKSDQLNLESQVLLRNQYKFKDGRSATGASSFLLKHQGKSYIITAKHMLNDWMGISPEVAPSEFLANLEFWVSHNPQNNRQSIFAESILSPNDDWDRDIIVMSHKGRPVALEPLNLSEQVPTPGDAFYVTGCPYEESNCSQNNYRIIYTGSNGSKLNFKWPNKRISSKGFSGAPILDKNGNAVAVYIGFIERDGEKLYRGESLSEEFQRIFQPVS